MIASPDRASPQLKARLAGVFYLAIIAGGLFAEAGVRQQIIASDPAQTVRNILANEQLYRLGLAVNLTYLVCNIPFVALFYDLFKVANRTTALIVLALVVTCTAVEAANLNNQIMSINLLSVSGAGLAPPELTKLVQVSLQNFEDGFALTLVFFGFACLLYGWLILQSGFVPRVLGALITLAGVCYLVNSYALFLAPELAGRMFPYILLPCFVGELGLALWLTIMGVNVERWNRAAQANAKG